MELFGMISKRVDTMDINTVTNWMTDVTEKLNDIDQQIKGADVHDVSKVIYLLEQQNDLQLCLELLDERLDMLLETQWDGLMEYSEDYAW